jgi:hypothetical protein
LNAGLRFPSFDACDKAGLQFAATETPERRFDACDKAGLQFAATETPERRFDSCHKELDGKGC